MSSNTRETLSPGVSPSVSSRPRPPLIARSISDMPPQPPRLHHGGDPKAVGGQLAQQLFTRLNRSSLDVSAPQDILSARSSPGVSRRASVKGGPGMDGALVGGLPGSSKKESDDTGGDIERKNVARTVIDLKQTMVDLSDLSSETTRLLDDTYSSVLEKMGTLQSIILGLKELALQSRETTASFGKEAAEVEDELDRQIRDFNNFQEHEERIRALRTRVDVSRDKISSLGRRVDVVRDMVEGWERADKEWQERTRRRLMVIWGITSTVIFVLALLYYGAQYRGSGGVSCDGPPVGDGGGEGIGGMNGSVNASSGIPGIDRETGDEPFPGFRRPRPKGGSADERLRLFDEL
ncbi:hypothetical protein VUR80DRAFT_1757 [Thermomyces stellatus]